MENRILKSATMGCSVLGADIRLSAKERVTFDDKYFRNIFLQLCHQPADALENESLEIKGWCNSERELTEKLADATSCLANAQGGVLLIGIDDGMGSRRFSPCPFGNV